MTFVGILIEKPCEPDESVLTFTHWQARKCIWAIFGDEISKKSCAFLHKDRLHPVFKVPDEFSVHRPIKIIDRHRDKPILLCATACGWALRPVEREARCCIRQAQQEDIIRI